MTSPNPNQSTLDVRDCIKTNFINYASYVIRDRALPDIRDGMKPVHRRVLYAMNQLHLDHNKAYKKSARIVGDVIGKYHPHGDSAVYDTMVRMAQEFSMRLPLVDGQGNFGSIDGDSPAAMRYTESRMTVFSDEIFNDIDKNTVNFIPNYDGTMREPSVLPLVFPNLLINGVQGIAVAMASDIPPHNPVEVMNAVMAMTQARIDQSELTTDDLVQMIPAPDFPTGGQVYSLGEMGRAIEQGRGRVRLRSVWHEEVLNGNRAIVVTEIPYQVNKVKLIERIVELGKSKRDNKTQVTIPPKVEGIIEVRDESDKDGIRLVIEVTDSVEPEIIFVQLCKMTDLETSISYNCTVINQGRPMQVGLRAILDAFIDHRIEVIVRRTRYLDDKARERQHILDGLVKAVNDIDAVLGLIKSAKTPAHAQVALIDYLDIDEVQANAILDMKLQRLTGIQIDNLKAEHNELVTKREEYARILGSTQVQMELVISESKQVSEQFMRVRNNAGRIVGERYTELAYHLSVFDRAALTPEEECVMYLSDRGYVRRLPVDEVNTQNRNTRGKSGFELKRGDFVTQTLSVHSHDIIIAVTNSGRAYGFYGYDIPVHDGGRHLSNVIDTKDDKIIRLMSVPTLEDDSLMLVMMTRKGLIKATRLSEYLGIMRRSGLNAIALEEGDDVIQVQVASGDDQVLSVTTDSKLLRYPVSEIRLTGRNSKGVKSQALDGDHVIRYADILKSDSEGYLATLTETGMIKASPLSDYPLRKSRATKGVRLFKQTERTGGVFKVLWTPELEGYDITVISEKGITNRIQLDGIRSTSRMTQGVSLIKLKKGDSIVDAIITPTQERDPDDEVEDVMIDVEGEVDSEA